MHRMTRTLFFTGMEGPVVRKQILSIESIGLHILQARNRLLWLVLTAEGVAIKEIKSCTQYLEDLEPMK